MKQEQRRMEEIMAQNRMIEAIKYKKAMDDERQKKKLQATAIVQQMEENELTRDWEAARNEAVRVSFKCIQFVIKIIV